MGWLANIIGRKKYEKDNAESMGKVFADTKVNKKKSESVESIDKEIYLLNDNANQEETDRKADIDIEL